MPPHHICSDSCQLQLQAISRWRLPGQAVCDIVLSAAVHQPLQLGSRDRGYLQFQRRRAAFPTGTPGGREPTRAPRRRAGGQRVPVGVVDFVEDLWLMEHALEERDVQQRVGHADAVPEGPIARAVFFCCARSAPFCASAINADAAFLEQEAERQPIQNLIRLFAAGCAGAHRRRPARRLRRCRRRCPARVSIAQRLCTEPRSASRSAVGGCSFSSSQSNQPMASTNNSMAFAAAPVSFATASRGASRPSMFASCSTACRGARAFATLVPRDRARSHPGIARAAPRSRRARRGSRPSCQRSLARISLFCGRNSRRAVLLRPACAARSFGETAQPGDQLASRDRRLRGSRPLRRRRAPQPVFGAAVALKRAPRARGRDDARASPAVPRGRPRRTARRRGTAS